MSKSKLGRNPLTASASKKSTAHAPKKTVAKPRVVAAYESSVPGFIGNLAAAVVAETMLFGLKTFLLARTTLSRRA